MQRPKPGISVIDIVRALLQQNDYQAARNYWKVLKNRLNKEGSETVTNCNQLKLEAEDGKLRLTDVASARNLVAADPVNSVTQNQNRSNFGWPK